MEITIISDTHGNHKKLKLPLSNKQKDIIIHCGDFSSNESSFYDFIEWYSSLNYKYKILIAGNHDKYLFHNQEHLKFIFNEYGIIYLQDESIIIEGIKFYGTPWSLPFGHGVFIKDEFELSEIWDEIDTDTDILITHTPPFRILDKTKKNKM